MVLWGAAARKLWSQSSPNLPDCLCNCTPFSLWSGCEHQQCARAMMDSSFRLTTPGQNRGGRGRTNIIHHGVRSTCASKLRWAAARRAKEAKKATPTKGKQRLHNAAAWALRAEPCDSTSSKLQLAGRAQQAAKGCGHCHAGLAANAKFCGQCGTAVGECLACKATLGSGAKFCSACGHQVGSSVSAASSGVKHTTSQKRKKSSSCSSSSSSQPPSKQQGSERARGYRVSVDISGPTNGRWHAHQED